MSNLSALAFSLLEYLYKFGHTIQCLETHYRINRSGMIIRLRIGLVGPLARNAQRCPIHWKDQKDLLAVPFLPIADLEALSTQRMKRVGYPNLTQRMV